MVTGRVALELPVPNAVVKAFAMFQMNLKKVPDEPETCFRRTWYNLCYDYDRMIMISIIMVVLMK